MSKAAMSKTARSKTASGSESVGSKGPRRRKDRQLQDSRRADGQRATGCQYGSPGHGAFPQASKISDVDRDDIASSLDEHVKQMANGGERRLSTYAQPLARCQRSSRSLRRRCRHRASHQRWPSSKIVVEPAGGSSRRSLEVSQPMQHDLMGAHQIWSALAMAEAPGPSKRKRERAADEDVRGARPGSAWRAQAGRKSLSRRSARRAARSRASRMRRRTTGWRT